MKGIDIIMINQDMNLTYEMFIRKAFNVKRWEDPAHLANAGTFDSGDIDQIKVAAGYAMAIFNSKYIESDPSLDEYCTKALKCIIDAKNKQEIYNVIVDYNQKVRNVN